MKLFNKELALNLSTIAASALVNDITQIIVLALGISSTILTLITNIKKGKIQPLATPRRRRQGHARG